MSFLDNLLDESKAFTFIEQNTEEWHRVRIGRFTSSEIWKLIVEPKSKDSKDPYKLSETAIEYVFEKVAETLTGQAKQQGYAFPLVWGMEKESEAIEHFERVKGLEVGRVGFYPYTDHAGGSPDGEISETAIIEIKCPYDSTKQIEYLMLNDQFDLKRNFRNYYWQCQANMLFTNKELCYFVSYDPRMIQDQHQMKIIEVKANTQDQELLIKKIEKAVEEKLKIISLL